MIIYKVSLDNSFYEFDSLDGATFFCNDNNINIESIDQYEKEEIPLRNKIPDVTAAQLRQAIILSGMTMSQIDAIFENLSEPEKSLSKVLWEYSDIFSRLHPLVDFVGASIGIEPEQIDAIWELAHTL